MVSEKYAKYYEQPTDSYYSYEGTLTANLEIDLKTANGDVLYNGQIINDGAGDFAVKIDDGIGGYGGNRTIKPGEYLETAPAILAKVTLVHSGTDASYRAVFW